MLAMREVDSEAVAVDSAAAVTDTLTDTAAEFAKGMTAALTAPDAYHCALDKAEDAVDEANWAAADDVWAAYRGLGVYVDTYLCLLLLLLLLLLFEDNNQKRNPPFKDSSHLCCGIG